MHLVRVTPGFMNSTYLKFAEDSRFQFARSNSTTRARLTLCRPSTTPTRPWVVGHRPTMTMSLTKFERQTARAECAGSQCRPAPFNFFDLSLRIGSKTRARHLLNTRETLESVTRFSDFWR